MAKMNEKKPSVTGTTHTLPFGKLEPSTFERMCLWLVEKEGYLRAEHLGLIGGEQGRDIRAYKPTSDGEKLWYFQCKRRKKIYAKTLIKEIDKIYELGINEPDLRANGIVFIVCCAISAKIRDEVRRFALSKEISCEFWGKTELDLKIKKYPEIVEQSFQIGNGKTPSTLFEAPSEKFSNIFSNKLDEIIDSFGKDDYDPKLNDKIDELIMLLKEQIERWDVPSVRFGTRELFLKLYKYSGEENILTNLYNIYEDLFRFAYSQRKQLLGSMIKPLSSIWFETWLSDYDIDKAEKSCDILLRLGIDFIDIDLSVAKDCLGQIDNAAGDMFEPEILSREILFGAVAEKREDESEELKEFFETIVNYIEWNDIYSHDADILDYLINSIEYAKALQEEYNIKIKSFEENYLSGIVEDIKNGKVRSFVDHLGDLIDEKDDDFNVLFNSEYLEKIILAYGKLYPEIHKEILTEINKKDDQKASILLEKIINANNYLKYVFKGEKMITSIGELIQFIERNSHFEERGVGAGFWGYTSIEFMHPLKNEEKQALKNLANKYDFSDSFEFEVNRHQMSFMMDDLVYKKQEEGSKKLIQFLKEIDEKIRISNIATGIEFKFR